METKSCENIKVESHQLEESKTLDAKLIQKVIQKENLKHEKVEIEITQPSVIQKSPSSTIDSNWNEKRKLIIRQLNLLLHVPVCDKQSNPDNEERCEVQHCGTIKQVLNHMKTCEERANCLVPHCRSSQGILNHWNSCTFDNCLICGSFRNNSQI